VNLVPTVLKVINIYAGYFNMAAPFRDGYRIDIPPASLTHVRVGDFAGADGYYYEATILV